MGREVFLNKYVAQVIENGYASAPLEEDAFDTADWLRRRYEAEVANTAAQMRVVVRSTASRRCRPAPARAAFYGIATNAPAP
jgi:hypothetical protein